MEVAPGRSNLGDRPWGHESPESPNGRGVEIAVNRRQPGAGTKGGFIRNHPDREAPGRKNCSADRERVAAADRRSGIAARRQKKTRRRKSRRV